MGIRVKREVKLFLECLRRWSFQYINLAVLAFSISSPLTVQRTILKIFLSAHFQQLWKSPPSVLLLPLPQKSTTFGVTYFVHQQLLKLFSSLLILQISKSIASGEIYHLLWKSITLVFPQQLQWIGSMLLVMIFFGI